MCGWVGGWVCALAGWRFAACRLMYRTAWRHAHAPPSREYLTPLPSSLCHTGLALELASPLLPRAFLLMACLGSVARAVTGVAGGATRMALTQHFALQRNAADIAAKEGSQVSFGGAVLPNDCTVLLGLLCG